MVRREILLRLDLHKAIRLSTDALFFTRSFWDKPHSESDASSSMVRDSFMMLLSSSCTFRGHPLQSAISWNACSALAIVRPWPPLRALSHEVAQCAFSSRVVAPMIRICAFALEAAVWASCLMHSTASQLLICSMSLLCCSFKSRNSSMYVLVATSHGGIAEVVGGVRRGASSLKDTGTWSESSSFTKGLPHTPPEAFESIMSRASMLQRHLSILDKMWTSSSLITLWVKSYCASSM